MAAHPRRTIPRFGPYLLLQTLGEGEFGKVKLGIHVQWGEEVAVKLIRRGNVDTVVRLSKVEREIEVLRVRFSVFSFLFWSPTHWFGSQTLKHPNIVRLYDVIETDKYIGIILEYASGGELFDHILAHRYLKERDAAKLFSQLISGVWYIHQKKIVHRDLKLENLLLDRNRNVIITDFGFANRFEHKADDLMQTSCGSPCYAAPELVISEGLYVGSAVDIWSCGVILYAMLAGYLPFDDDPANPDGDNINLLYKYIVSTPLSFPDYISTEARELLSMMLVPDPTRRANLDSVMRHPWLSVHAGPPRTDGSPSAFGKTVDELEKAALDQHQQRRLAYQRQMRAAAAAASQSNASHGREATHPGVPSRSRSTQPEYLYESSADQGISSPPAAVRSNTTTGIGTSTPIGAPVAGNKPTFGSPTAQGITPDDPFAHPVSSSAGATAMTTNSTTAKFSENVAPTQGHKHNSSGSGGGFRHTIQVEYDDPSNKRDERRMRMGTDYQHSQVQPKPQQSQLTSSTPTTQDRRVLESTSAGKPLPVPPPSSTAPSTSTKLFISPAMLAAKAQEQPQQPSVKSQLPSRPDAQKPPADVPSNSSPDLATDKETSSATSSIGKKSITHEQLVQSSASPSQSKGHKKGKSSTDRSALTKIFGSGTSVRASADASAGDEKEKARVRGSPLMASSERYGGEKEPKLSLSPTPAPMEKEKGRDRESKTRRNTLTVMVEPISRTIRAGKISASKTPTSVQPTNHGNTSLASLAPPSLRSQPLPPSIPGTPTSSSRGTITAESKGAIDGGSSAASTGDKDYIVTAATATATASVHDESGNSASSNKAKKVMAWFRAKSKGRDSMLGSNTATAVVASNHSNSYSSREDDPRQRQVVTGGSGEGFAMMLTTPTSTTMRIPQTPGTNGGKNTPGYPKRTASTNTENSMMSFSTSGIVQKIRHSVGVGNSVSSTPGGSSKIRNAEYRKESNDVDSSKKPHEKLRIHHGAVDQTTITTRPPVEVMNHVKEILEGMGMEIYKESEFKYRCVRQKRKKGIVNSVDGNDRGTGQEDVAVFTMAGSAASDGVCFHAFLSHFFPCTWDVLFLVGRRIC